jgi:hypothetical protein
MKKLVLSGIALSAMLFSGCSQHLGNFTAMSTDAYNPLHLDAKHKVASNVEVDTASLQVLFIPIGGVTKLDQAVSETAHSNNGDYLKNAQVHAYGWTAILFGKQGYRIKADVYNTQD